MATEFVTRNEANPVLNINYEKPVGKTFVCGDHGPIALPKHLFFWLQTWLIRQSKLEQYSSMMLLLRLLDMAKKMIDELGYTDPNTLPPPIGIKRGITKNFQMQFSISNTVGNIDFVIDDIFEDMLALEEIAP